MTARVARTEKLDLRLSSEAKRILRAAADIRHKSVTEFVLDSALTAAEDVLTEQRSVRLNAAQWTAFVEALDAPPQRHPRLERLLKEPSVFD
jgi:uncharacterized protein (DUF1778 family)